jgi:probable DNA repair protein
VAEGLTAWETADILPFGAFVERLWEDALYSRLTGELPLLLTPAQEFALWDQTIRGARIPDAVFSATSAAAQCRQAWHLAHAWRLDARAGGDPNRDVRAWLDWSERYARATASRSQTDTARLPDVVAPLLANAALRKPAALALCGFDIVTPQLRDFLRRLAAAGCELLEVQGPGHAAQPARVELTQHRDEIETAARWARTRLEANPAARIGVVVPDLARDRARCWRTFAQVMRPGYLLEEGGAPLPFDISLGRPLSDCPLVGDALLVLMLAGPAVPFEYASRLVRSPFIGGAETEIDVRARLDRRLRKRSTPALTLDALAKLASGNKAPRAALFVDRLRALAEVRKASLFGAKGTADWARAFSEALRVVGFPGERTLDSSEYQALQRWHQLLCDFATLEQVAGKMGYAEACERLGRMAEDAIFQPESPEVPVQVLGVLESAGQEFDHLWVMGLTDEAWPLPPRPNPFIPIRVQRAAGIPQSDPATSLELDRRITAGWLAAAPEVVLSHARMRDETELAPSALIASIPTVTPDSLGLANFGSLRDAVRRAGTVSRVSDGRAPAAGEGPRSGGTGLFRDQAACPFRAFARHRLDADPLEPARFGLDARDRGSLLHAMLAATWKAIGTRERLHSTEQGERLKILGKCADAAIADMARHRGDTLKGRFAKIERARLVRLADEWLANEMRRGPFEVVALEEKQPITWGGITINAKLDRMDRLPTGLAVIDYKTGECKTASWLGKRPDEPQLPLYALSQPDVVAVAFGQVRTGQMRFRGLSRDEDALPDVTQVTDDQSRAAKQYRDWEELVAMWKTELEAIAEGFSKGDARVDPKRQRDTCAMCDQQTFCRIAEKAPFGVKRKDESDE